MAPDATPRSSPGAAPERRASTGFVPSSHGLRFDNAFPGGPALTVDLGVTRLGIGNAARGLCGGMVFTALDYWTLCRPPPDDVAPPAPSSPHFRYLLRRLIDSWGLPAGPLTYLTLMHPLCPDGDRAVGPLTVRGRGWRMVTREWPAVRARLATGRPCPLGLVTVSSGRPTDIGANHQALAHGYEQVGTDLRIRVYDPNRAGADDVALTLDLADPTRPVPVTMGSAAGPGRRVLCFFPVRYEPRTPPGPVP